MAKHCSFAIGNTSDVQVIITMLPKLMFMNKETVFIYLKLIETIYPSHGPVKVLDE